VKRRSRGGREKTVMEEGGERWPSEESVMEEGEGVKEETEPTVRKTDETKGE